MKRSSVSGFKTPFARPPNNQTIGLVDKENKPLIQKKIKSESFENGHSLVSEATEKPISPNKSAPKKPLQKMVEEKTDSETDVKVWKVYHTKRSNKKHKQYEDGVLVIRGTKLILLDEGGQTLGQTLTYTHSRIAGFGPSSKFDLGSHEVEITGSLPVQDYLSGKVFLPNGNASDQAIPTMPTFQNKPFRTHLKSTGPSKPAGPLHNPQAPGAVILYEPPASTDKQGKPLVHIVLDPNLAQQMRPHQKEGVKFMFECVMGLRSFNGNGCILADEMGLGKTLQSIALIWTLMRQGLHGKPTISAAKQEKVLIITPASLVKNWQKEIVKWLGSTKLPTMIVGESNKVESQKIVEKFRDCATSIAPVLVISYEQLRNRGDVLQDIKFGLVICDEGHRLKNSNIQTSKMIMNLQCSRRVILSGTPIQNDLEEFYAMCDFVNPGVLGTSRSFKGLFGRSIESGLDENASKNMMLEGQERSKTLSSITSEFILRRTSSILDKFLPPKTEQILFCQLSPLQLALYREFLQNNFGQLIGGQSDPLSAIINLKKLCNHPYFVHPSVTQKESCLTGIFPADFDLQKLNSEHSGKFLVVTQLLSQIKQTTNDKVVLVSHSTKMLDMFEKMAKQENYSFLRLDGATEQGKRQKLVDQFNDAENKSFLFLLSTKAGGVGLNLIGGNRLIMYDSDWNPATDLQAMARVWRDGQKKNVWIYRLFSTGSIEEKIYQRQLAKDSLSQSVLKKGKSTSAFSKEDLKDIFSLAEKTLSDTHDLLNCSCGLTLGHVAPKKTSLAQHEVVRWLHSDFECSDPILAPILQSPSTSISLIFSNSIDSAKKEDFQIE